MGDSSMVGLDDFAVGLFFSFGVALTATTARL
jgi:hypothetical protein